MTRIRTFNLKRDLVALIELYQLCFAEAPWYERFIFDELVEYFTHIVGLKHSIFLVAERDGELIGAAVAFPLCDKPDVLELIGNTKALYLAELFVHSDMRGQGVAKQLVEERFRMAYRLGYRDAFVRTSVDQPLIVNLYMGRYRFLLITSQAVTSTKFINGVEQKIPDTRLIMGGEILRPIQPEREYRGCGAL
ncbi:GNAT family N-acetyltransferase [Patescibacteria group bacterium]|nr:GNAT family N-acetyltransferase [Patescibacteria group bacterium]MBU1907413.1 GNAT family N-acetyltransferase [Patescibacteria group bacterium]